MSRFHERTPTWCRCFSCPTIAHFYFIVNSFFAQQKPLQKGLLVFVFFKEDAFEDNLLVWEIRLDFFKFLESAFEFDGAGDGFAIYSKCDSSFPWGIVPKGGYVIICTYVDRESEDEDDFRYFYEESYHSFVPLLNRPAKTRNRIEGSIFA